MVPQPKLGEPVPCKSATERLILRIQARCHPMPLNVDPMPIHEKLLSPLLGTFITHVRVSFITHVDCWSGVLSCDRPMQPSGQGSAICQTTNVTSHIAKRVSLSHIDAQRKCGWGGLPGTPPLGWTKGPARPSLLSSHFRARRGTSARTRSCKSLSTRHVDLALPRRPVVPTAFAPLQSAAGVAGLS
jgi:hypothetical protein